MTRPPTCTRRLLFAALAVVCSGTTAVAVETIRVETSGGVPRLLVDGKPVRARMFWGAPASRPLPIGPEAKKIEFEFSPTEEEPGRATMHLRFGPTPGVVSLDDIRVVVASPAFRRDSAERLAALIEHLESKFGDHVAHAIRRNPGVGRWRDPLMDRPFAVQRRLSADAARACSTWVAAHWASNR